MRERKLQVVIKRKNVYARTTYVGLDGKRHAVWRAGKNKTDAKKNLTKALKELENDEGAIVNAKRTFGELAKWYTKRYLVPPEYRDGRIVKGKRSWQTEGYQLRAAIEYFKGYKLRSITHGELEKYKEHRLATPIIATNGKGEVTKTRPRTIASVNRELMYVRAILRRAQKEGWLLRSPFGEHDSLVRMSDERRRERTLSYGEETRLLAACGKPRAHLRPILICALSTGMRLGEILKLDWPDVDFEHHEIRIISTNTKTMTERRAPITPSLMEELRRLRDKSPDETGSVFGVSTNVKRSFRKACEIAGITHGGIAGLTFHSLRHTAATRMIAQGLDITEVARILGHSQVSTTYRYISADSRVIDKARAALTFRPPPASQTSD